MGESSSRTSRENKFEKADTNSDGFINIDEFLFLVYNYHPPDDMEGLRGVAKICSEMAEQIRHVNRLSLGEQLYFGLF